MHKRKTGRSKHIDFILLDILCVELSFILAYFIRMKMSVISASEAYDIVNVLLLLMHFCVVFWTECYSGIIRRGYFKELKQVIKHNCFILGGVLIILFCLKESETYSRMVIGLFFVIDIVLMFVFRTILKKIIFIWPGISLRQV